MKVKIKGLDPTGVVTEEAEFEIPLINKKFYDKRNEKLKNNSIGEYEPMIQNRYILEIGEYKYFLRRDGELTKIYYD